MPITDVRTPSGEIISVSHPEGATDEQILAYAKGQALKSAPKLPDEFVKASPGYRAGRYMSKGSVPDWAAAGVNALQGPLFGFADEVIGGLNSLADKATLKDPSADTRWGGGDTYTSARDYARGLSDRWQEDHPIGALAGQVGAGMAVGSQVPQLLWKNPTLKQKIGTMATQGALGGMVSAVGNSTDQSDLEGDVKEGAVLGATLPFVGLAGAKAVGGAATFAAKNLTESGALKYAREKVAEAFLRDAPAGVSDPLGAAARRMDRLGQEAVVADSGSGAGMNVRSTLDLLASLPGRTKNSVESVIRQRQAGAGGRMRENAQTALSPNGDRLPDSLAYWMEQRSAEAKPLYDLVRQQKIVPDAELAATITAAMRSGAGATAKRIANNEQTDFVLGNLMEKVSDPLAAGAYRAPQFKELPLGQLDLLKQGLDNRYKELVRAAGKNTPEAASLWGLRQRLVSKIDQMTQGSYAEARKAFAGPSALMEAANDGRDFLKLPTDYIKQFQVGRDRSEIDAFRIGAFEALRDKLGTQAGRTEVAGLWKNDNMRERLTALFGSEREFRQFAAGVAAEERLMRIQSVGRGSQTMARQFAEGDSAVGAAQDMGKALVDAKTGNVLGFAGAASKVWNRAKLPEPVRDEMGRILLSRGDDAARNLAAMQRLQAEIAARRNAWSQGLGLGTSAFIPAIDPMFFPVRPRGLIDLGEPNQ